MAKPLNVSSYLWVGFYFILSRGGIIDVPLDFAWVLDVKRVIDQRIYVTREIPADRMARRILIFPSRRNCWRNEEQPKEHGECCQSNDAPRNQIGFLRQFGFLSLVKRAPLGVRLRPHRTLRWNAFAASLHTPSLRLRVCQTAHPARAPSDPLFHSQSPAQLPKVQSFDSLLDGLNLDSLSADLDSLSMDRSLTD